MSKFFFSYRNKKNQKFLIQEQGCQAKLQLTKFSPNFFEIDFILRDQEPHIYILSKIKQSNGQYYLSYVRNEDQVVVHVQFRKKPDDIWEYKNGTDNKEFSLNKIINKIIHFEEGKPKPRPYKSC